MESEQNELTGMATLYSKMARVMAGVKRMPKLGWNKHFNYAFVQDSDVLDTIRELMVEHNLAIFPEILDYQLTGKKTAIKMMFTIACGDTGASRSMLWFGEADDGQDKGIGKAATLAEKYFLLKLFLVSTGDESDDPDTGVGSDGKQSRQNRATTSPNGNNPPQQPQNATYPPSSAKNGQTNGNGMDRDTARQKAIKMLIDAGVDPNAAIKIEPPPNPPTSSNNLDWATRMIERAKAAS